MMQRFLSLEFVDEGGKVSGGLKFVRFSFQKILAR